MMNILAGLENAMKLYVSIPQVVAIKKAMLGCMAFA
jgi:hypothetical protein